MKINRILLFFAILLVFQPKQTMSQTIGWKKLSYEAPAPLYGVYCISCDTVIAVGAWGCIIRTTDGGTNWTTIPSNTSDTLYEVQFVNKTIGYAAGGNGTILKTNDMGQSWTNIGISTNMELFSMSFINNDTGWVAGGEGDLYYTLGNKGILLKTTNGGTNWIVDSTYHATIASVFLIDNDTGYIAMNLDSTIGSIASLRKTTNGGISFFNIDQNTLGYLGFYTDIHFTDAETGFYAKSTDGVYKTTNYGNTWGKVVDQWSVKSLEVIDSCSFFYSWSDMPGDGAAGFNSCTAGSLNGPGHRIFDFSFINLDSGFAVGSYSDYYAVEGVIYKRGLLTNINEKETKGINIYPNPFSDKITIDFFDPDIDKSKMKISIFNSTGQKIVNMPELQNNQLTIDLSVMPCGIYYLIIQDNNRIFHTQKIIKN